jgi:hypothetical protein
MIRRKNNQRKIKENLYELRKIADERRNFRRWIEVVPTL